MPTEEIHIVETHPSLTKSIGDRVGVRPLGSGETIRAGTMIVEGKQPGARVLQYISDTTRNLTSVVLAPHFKDKDGEIEAWTIEFDPIRS